ncbi:hypothetical protein AX16_002628 [Volvariella volvacea WC 439]|nr:hypothetical protein AX16_002628 [Volvariella volvacea WC 439]
MYRNGYGAASPPISNNPFAADPTNAHSRFPDITGAGQNPAASQYTSWVQSTGSAFSSPGYPSQLQQQQTNAYAQQSSFGQQSQPPFMINQQQGYSSSPSQPFQPSSSFGQQLVAASTTTHISGSSYGYLQGQPTGLPSSQPTGYNPVQQQLQSSGYIAQFDPYASIGQGWDGTTQQPQQQFQQLQPQPQQHLIQQQASNQFLIPIGTTTTGAIITTSRGPNGELHPREFIKTHKSEIESWDTYAWRQFLNSFDSLKTAWENRKTELAGKISQYTTQLQYGGYGYYPGQLQQEITRLQGLQKEAEANFDSSAASSFQMNEVFTGYRQSGDAGSKRRVREASNAALQHLPDWPAVQY